MSQTTIHTTNCSNHLTQNTDWGKVLRWLVRAAIVYMYICFAPCTHTHDCTYIRWIGDMQVTKHFYQDAQSKPNKHTCAHSTWTDKGRNTHTHTHTHTHTNT